MLKFPVAILAGGLATRLRPLTEAIPKSLVSINGEPLIVHQLRKLRQQGCSEVVLCLGFLGEMIESLVKDGHEFGLRIEYSYDGDRLMGTGGALRRALPRIDANACFVLYGDSYLCEDFQKVEESFLMQGKPALMTVFRNEGSWDSSNVAFAGGTILRYSKTHKSPEMRYIDYGLGVLSRSTIASIPADQASDLSLLYERLVENGEMAAYEVYERFYEAGSFQGIEDLGEFLRRQANG